MSAKLFYNPDPSENKAPWYEHSLKEFNGMSYIIGVRLHDNVDIDLEGEILHIHVLWAMSMMLRVLTPWAPSHAQCMHTLFEL